MATLRLQDGHAWMTNTWCLTRQAWRVHADSWRTLRWLALLQACAVLGVEGGAPAGYRRRVCSRNVSTAA
ncbi:hypothetical protein XCY_002094 [Xanthomonas euroxanthea]|uniref:hypothetical protein n=1 Tax=Xanthomonas euroxanthea TaxID=2259622 RepID=UPI001AFBA7D6|nr:hypothetical protein [Xanthomonas euroxanthea]CAG2090142.1 hypothetical protein XCY_002094 [Xanthomonas euroxanthea]